MTMPLTRAQWDMGMRWGRYALLAAAAVIIPAYRPLPGKRHGAAAARYAIDIAVVRRLADSDTGAKPQAIHVETVTRLTAPGAIVFEGGGSQPVDLPVSSYQLVFPDHVAIVDAALPADMAKAMTASTFDSAAYARLSGALSRATLIVVTHEHPDHIGGLLAQPNLERLLTVSRLTREQVTELTANLTTGLFAALHLSPDIFRNYTPLDYVRYQAIAPGVVLIKAPGHTPGSQMVYVRRADGVEFLLVGDVAWQMGHITPVREKGRQVPGEDRRMIWQELVALHKLHAAVPALHMIPGHDATAIASLVKSGLLVKGF